MLGVAARSLSSNQKGIRFPKAEGYGAQLGDLWVRLAAGPERGLRYFTRDSLAGRIDQRAVPGHAVLDVGYTWARTELDGGEGLDWDPRELALDEAAAANDVRRYWDSKNINVSSPPAGQPYTISLAKQFSEWAGDTGVVDIGASSRNLFTALADSVNERETWADAPGNMPIGEPMKMLGVSPGDEVMAVTVAGNVWYREPDGASFTLVYTAGVPVQATWFVKGRFVAFRKTVGISNGELGELLPDGTFIVFDTTGEYDVSAVVGTGPSIVAAVGDGTIRSYVPEQSNQTDPDSVNVVIRGRTELPKGEVASVLGGSGSVLTILTLAVDAETNGVTTRFYRAEALSSQYDYIVGGLQLQREWFDTDEQLDVRSNMTQTRDAIWFSISEADGQTYVWRFDLVTFGLSRHAKAFTGIGYATTMFDGKGAVLDGDTGLVWLESEKYQPSGYLITPNLTFGLNTDIAWIASVVEAYDLADTGAQVELYRSSDPQAILNPDDPSWVLVRRLSNPSQTGDEIPMVGVTSRTVALMLRLYPSGQQSKTPQVSRLAIRGLPTHRDWIVHVPVNVSDMVEVPGRRPVRIPGLGDELHREVLSLTGKSLALTVLDPPLAFRGVVDNVEEPVTYISARGSVSVYAMVEFRGTRITSSVTATGDAGAGVGLLGVATLGIGQTIEAEA